MIATVASLALVRGAMADQTTNLICEHEDAGKCTHYSDLTRTFVWLYLMGPMSTLALELDETSKPENGEDE